MAIVPHRGGEHSSSGLLLAGVHQPMAIRYAEHLVGDAATLRGIN